MLDARQVEGRDGKAGSSSSSRPSEVPSRQTTKRRKLEHPQGDASRYFSNGIPSRRDSLTIPSTSASFRPSSVTATASRNAMIIDAEGGTPGDSHEPIVLRTSSPDPVDVIHPNFSYVFDQNKPSPIHTFRSSPNEKRKSPQDCESTLRVHNTMKKAMESVSRPDSDDDNVRRLSKILPGLLSRNESTVEAQAPSSRGNLKEKMALYERSQLRSPLTHFDLPKLVQTRKNGMKLKQVGLSPLVYTTVPSTEQSRCLGVTLLHYPFNIWTPVPPGHLASLLAPRSHQGRKRQKAEFLPIFL